MNANSNNVLENLGLTVGDILNVRHEANACGAFDGADGTAVSFDGTPFSAEMVGSVVDLPAVPAGVVEDVVALASDVFAGVTVRYRKDADKIKLFVLVMAKTLLVDKDDNRYSLYRNILDFYKKENVFSTMFVIGNIVEASQKAIVWVNNLRADTIAKRVGLLAESDDIASLLEEFSAEDSAPRKTYPNFTEQDIAVYVPVARLVSGVGTDGFSVGANVVSESLLGMYIDFFERYGFGVGTKTDLQNIKLLVTLSANASLEVIFGKDFRRAKSFHLEAGRVGFRAVACFSPVCMVSAHFDTYDEALEVANSGRDDLHALAGMRDETVEDVRYALDFLADGRNRKILSRWYDENQVEAVIKKQWAVMVNALVDMGEDGTMSVTPNTDRSGLLLSLVDDLYKANFYVAEYYKKWLSVHTYHSMYFPLIGSAVCLPTFARFVAWQDSLKSDGERLFAPKLEWHDHMRKDARPENKEAYEDLIKATIGNRRFKGFAVIDLETNSLSEDAGDILEVGVVYCSPNFTESYADSVFARPDGTVYNRDHLVGLESLHRVSANLLQKDGVVDQEQLAGAIHAMLDGWLPVAQNAVFETKFINVLLRKYGYNQIDVALDTKVMFGYIEPDMADNLDVIADYYNIANPGHHAAENDAQITALALARIIESFDFGNIFEANAEFEPVSLDLDYVPATAIRMANDAM